MMKILKKLLSTKLPVSLIVSVLCLTASFTYAQTTISTQPTFSVNNGYGLTTFNFQNTNAFPVTITGVNACATSTNASTFKLWYKTTPVAGPPGVISTANGWVLAAQQAVTSTIGFFPNNVPEPVITGASLVIPANTTYGIAVAGWETNGSGNMNYYTMAAANLPTTTFSAGGCNIITGTNISYATTAEANAPTFTPRGFVGSLTFMAAGAYTCSTATFPTIVDIASNVDTVCNNGSAAFTLNTAMPSATGIFYQWQYATAPTGPWTNIGTPQSTAAYTATPITVSRWYKMQVLCGSSVVRTSDSVYVHVRPTPVPAATITASGNNICSGTPVTFTGAITNGGTTPFYQWKLNGNNVGGNSPTYTHSALAQGDQIQLSLTSNALCASPTNVNSNTITMTVVNSVTPDVTITSNPSLNTICSGTPVTFTASPVNGGTTPSYQWRINGVNVGTNSNTFTTTSISNADVISVVLTTSLPCYSKQKDTSNNLTFYVTPSVTPDVSISSNTPNNTACKGAVVHFSAIIAHPGLNPAVQWKVNGLPVGANNLDYFVSTLNQGDIVSCELTSNALCRTKNKDTSNSIVMNIANMASPTLVKTGNTLSTVASYATYQWLYNGANIGGATNPTFTVTAPGNYWVHVTDNIGCEGESNVLWVPYVLGLSQVAEKDGIKLYPKPAQDKVYISSPVALDVKVYNSQGQLVLSAKQTKEVSLQTLSDGNYLFLITNAKGDVILREKILKTSH